MATIPHFRLPLQLGAGGTFRTVEQDDDDDILQGVAVVLSTPMGRQVEIPSYGLRGNLFRNEVDTSDIQEAVAAWQPRARVGVNVTIDQLDDLVSYVRVGVDNA